MNLAQGARKDSISPREALSMLAAVAAVRSAGAAEQAIMQPISLDHVNIRVSDTAGSGAFYIELFDTPVLRNPALRAQPTSPPSEGFFLKFSDGYLAISQAFAPDKPDLDDYSLGIHNYDKAKLAAKLQDGAFAVLPRSSNDAVATAWRTGTPDRDALSGHRPYRARIVAAVHRSHRHTYRGSRAGGRFLRPAVRRRDRVRGFGPFAGNWIRRLGS